MGGGERSEEERGVLSDDLTGQQQHRLTSGPEPEAPDSPLDAGLADSHPAAAEPGYLLFRCAGVDCAVPLAALREVLPRCPSALPLPHSPEWLLGVFALRAELVGLADPAPLLFDAAHDSLAPRTHGAALLAGSDERVLAWAVESIGATAPLAQGAGAEHGGGQPAVSAAGVSGPGDRPGEIDGTGPGIAALYSAGAVAASGRRYAVINVGALLADMLRALEERPADA